MSPSQRETLVGFANRLGVSVAKFAYGKIPGFGPERTIDDLSGIDADHLIFLMHDEVIKQDA